MYSIDDYFYWDDDYITIEILNIWLEWHLINNELLKMWNK